MPVAVQAPRTRNFQRLMFLILPVLIVFGVALMFPRAKFHLIREDGGGGYLLWRADEAYLFMFERPVGYYLSGAELFAEPINEYFYAPAVPNNSAWALITLHVTTSGVERHVQKSMIVGMNSFTPLGDDIYANCPGGICRWSGTQFELISREQEQKIGAEDKLVSELKQLYDANGWSRRPIRSAMPGESQLHSQFSVEVGKQFSLLVTEGNPTSVYLQRLNHSKQGLWYSKQGLSIVSKAKYERVFGTH